MSSLVSIYMYVKLYIILQLLLLSLMFESMLFDHHVCEIIIPFGSYSILSAF